MDREAIQELVKGRQCTEEDVLRLEQMPLAEALDVINEMPIVESQLPLKELHGFFGVENTEGYKRLKQQYEQARVTARDYSRAIQQQQEVMRRCADEMRSMTHGPRTMVEDNIKHMSKWLSTHPYYSPLEIRSERIVLVTRPTEVTWQPPKNCIALSEKTQTVDLGRFQVVVRKSLITVEPYEGNLVIDRDNEAVDEWEDGQGMYFHPHVDSDGIVCWGTAGEIYSEYKASGSAKLLTDTLDGLMSVLTKYNPDSPYRDLEQFADAYDVAIDATYAEPGGTAWVEGEGVYGDDILEVMTIDGETTYKVKPWRMYNHFFNYAVRIDKREFVEVEEVDGKWRML